VPTRCSLPTAASPETGDRHLRSHAPPGDLALDRQLLPRRRRCLAGDGLPRVAVLPEGMSASVSTGSSSGSWTRATSSRPGHREQRQGDLRRCHELSLDQDNVILNQFCEFGNHIVHRSRPVRRSSVSSSTCARSGRAQGTGVRLGDRIGRHDRRRDTSRTGWVAHRRSRGAGVPDASLQRVGEHNIQGIGDKHVPLIHNVMGTDVVIAISDVPPTRSTCSPIPTQRAYLASRGVSREMITALGSFGLSSWCNVLPPSSSPSGYTSVKTISSHSRHRRRGHVPERARRSAQARLDRRVHGGLSSPGPRRARSRRGRRPCPGLLRPRPEPDLQPWYYTWSNSRACRSRSSRSAAIRVSGADCSSCPVWDDLITELNGRSGALATA